MIAPTFNRLAVEHLAKFLAVSKYALQTSFFIFIMISLSIQSPDDRVYSPNHAAPAPTIVEIRPACAIDGSGSSINHTVE
jgi:hypothetical protein